MPRLPKRPFKLGVMRDPLALQGSIRSEHKTFDYRTFTTILAVVIIVIMATAEVESVHLVPSHMRCVPGSVNIKLAKFPSPTKKIENLDPSKVASNLVDDFNKALDQKNYSAVANLFVEDGYWRDHLALSWVFRTIQTPPHILDFLKSCAESRDGFRLKSVDVDAKTVIRSPKVVPVDASGTVFGIQFFITVTTVLGTGIGIMRLVEQGGQWKIFTLYTRLEELRGHEEAINHQRAKGADHGGKPGRKNWAEKRAAEADFNAGNEPAVLVVGAGQAGLTAAARLKMLGVETLVIDQNERVGDNWRKRYHQLVLHDPVWYDHMPYLNFPAQWPIFTPKDKLAQFFESYATLLELNVHRQPKARRWDERYSNLPPSSPYSGHWTLWQKNQPSMKGIENFKGDRLCHSSEFSGARENSQGKKAIVVGSCNSAHDIAQDFLERGYDITIVQRSSTHVVSSKAITDIGLKGIYSEDGPPVDDADILIHGLPTRVLKAIQVNIAERQAECDKEILDGLDRAGFKVDRGPDGAGLFFKYFQRGGGYYIDVGASQLIADGKIKVKQGQEIDEVLPHGLRFEDGTELEADEIVFATGVSEHAVPNAPRVWR
ncbi:hypothetical protein CIB48_g12099 [Xylaria polymorpha]|nr:hypothetical protein CIB48_g12099 [Xylaria polymorpha]